MIRKFLLLLFCVATTSLLYAQKHPAGQKMVRPYKTMPYQYIVDEYTRLASSSSKMQFATVGKTDTQYPLAVMFCSNDGQFNIDEWKSSNKLRILINNGIHPGEYDGIEASLRLVKNIANGKTKIPNNVVLAIIPSFNIYGTVNLRRYSRANQVGPSPTGFRGNAQNLDLNRDFVKMDALESQSLARLIHALDPDVLIDNHVSNGADYQYVMTLLSTQHNKLGGAMGKYLNEVFEPKIYTDMKKRNFELTPYVNVWGKTPDKGWQEYLETPRYLSGFAAMFHTYAFVAETHMLKPFQDRVDATYQLMLSIMTTASENATDIQATRSAQKDAIANSSNLPIAWAIDTTQHTTITFKGYEGKYKPSEITGKQRLYYDRNAPYEKLIPYYNTYKPSQTVKVPHAYVIAQGWHNVVEKLRVNGVYVRKLSKDSVVNATISNISNYETTPQPYEGHYLHSNITVEKVIKHHFLRKGDYIVVTNQPAKRYIVETLEATAPDGFFAWGFFDAILQQKEWFSSYVFEDLAVTLLRDDAELKQKFEDKKQGDADFAKDARAQLIFIYRNSKYHEPEHMRYPVYRLD